MIQYVRSLLALCCVLLAIPASAGSLVIPDIAGQTKDTLAEQLGQPDGCEAAKQGEKCWWGFDLEIVFINGKADWLTVSGLDSLPYSSAALSGLGLSTRAPDQIGDDWQRWHGLDGLRELTLYKSGNNVWYAYVKTTTP
ncbi:hypothetical protein GCM10023116_19650 [Kistimonas scapharcae]|uniref:Uncharacterized protein n=1 Tax=Kistimonas scapharcae TaxID=1036133 RepID=A0ABP8V362_9GAMM